MEKNNYADSWFNFKPMVGERITSGATKDRLSNEVRLVIGDLELSLQFKKHMRPRTWPYHLHKFAPKCSLLRLYTGGLFMTTNIAVLIHN